MTTFEARYPEAFANGHQGACRLGRDLFVLIKYKTALHGVIRFDATSLLKINAAKK